MNTNLLIGAGLVLAFAWYNSRQRKRSPEVYVNDEVAGNYNARTIPPFGIFVKEKESNNQALLKHETAHWEQYQKMGLLKYYFSYVLEMQKYGYDQMPMEKTVRTNESAYCRENYTECVRKGTAATVNNPQFRM